MAHTQSLWRRLPSWRWAAVASCAVVVALVQLGGSVAAVQSPQEDGQWSAPSAWPIVAVHMSLEPDGKVFALDGFGNALNSERLWNPGTGTFEAVPYGRNLFCSGHVQLSDGRTLLVGGHINANEGLADTTIFNPATKTYFRGPDMSVGRWYPTATQLADGRVFTIGGDNIVQDRPGVDPPFSDASVNSLPSVYNPRTNTWTDLPGARLTSPLYPYLFVLSDGRIINVGPDKITRVINPATWTWSTIATSTFDGHSAVMYRPNKIMKAGTWADPDFNGSNSFNADGRTAVLDMNAPTPAWRSTAPMAHGRSYHNLTLLPDGTVFASGGQSTSDGTNLDDAVLPAEIWNPDTETWTTVAPLVNGRLYHSTALLLKDGRVLMAGGGALPGRATDQRNAEIYSPPYLFRGPRPTISAIPATANYGDSFDVTTPNAAQIAKVSLIRSPSVTHAFDMNQRFQFLNFTPGAGKVTVQAPATANLAPPGDYLLFLVDTDGVPSVGEFIRVADTIAPSAPSNLIATGSPGQVSLSWTASTDNGGVAHYNVHRSTTAGFTPSQANRIAQPVGTNYVDGNLNSGTYYYRVIAEDGAGNLSPASNQAQAAVLGDPAVAAYGFDAGSGTTAADQSGNGNNGTIANATWATTGRFGKALSFNGTNAAVTVLDSSSLDLTGGMTLEGWVNPNAGGDFRTLIVKERPGDLVYGLYSSSDTNRPQSQVTVGGTARLLNGTATIPTGAWTHLAATYDGTTQRLFVNGTQVSTLAVAGAITTSNNPLKIGGNSIWGEWFTGLIDEVRVYDRALSAAEIQADMNTAITNPDGIPPSAPGTLTATGGLGQVSLSWGPATDNVGVARYNVHRSTTPGFTPTTANRIAQPTGTSYVDSGLPAGTYYYKVTAEDAAGNIGPASNEATATATSDTTPPTAPSLLIATAGSGQVGLNWGASFDAGGIAHYNVHRSTTAGFVPSPANRIGQPTGTSYSDVGVPQGTFYYKVTAQDPAGNISDPSNEAQAIVQAPPPVAAYGFDAGSGTNAADQSGNGNTGTIANATWATTGRFGKALSFNGTNAAVTVPDSSSLDLTTGMTLEAWVNPNPGGDFRTLVVKEMPGNLVYGLYSSSNTNRPQSEVHVGGSARILQGSASIPSGSWTHLASTYDGSIQRLYVNGTQVATLASSGPIATSNSPLKIGGNAVWAEWFTGLIDEVRVYNRALSPGEIQADMNTSISPSDQTPPSAPGTLTATGSLNSAQLNWGAATDNVGVVRYNVHRSTTPGFTPTTANRIAQPTGTSHTDNVAAGTYYYKVTAEDAAGNIGPPSNEASATVGDTVAPSAPGTLTATGEIGRATLSWGPATDNVGVVEYNVHRSTTPGFTPTTANRIAQPTGTGYTDTITPGTYYYKVTAEDAAGNIGPASNEASATVTADTQAPTAPFLLGSVTGGTVNLSWSGSTDNVGVVKYNVHRGTTPGFTPTTGNRIAQPTGETYADTGRPPGTYFYKVTAEDAAGNVSVPSNEVTATVNDVVPPSPPTGLNATAVGTTINLSWTAATDDVGVVRYNVHRGTSAGFTPTTANRIAQPTGTTHSDPGLAPGTWYYKVTAEDAAGNIGPVSNTANATVLDTTPPTAPTSVSATGGAGQATVSWTAATDNVGVVNYNVHRSTTSGFTPTTANRIAQPTGTGHTDLGLAAGTYYYKVTAQDAAGNVGPTGNEASATVTAPPPTGLVASYGLDTGSGATAVDQSGNANNGALTNATWAGAGAGRFGNALSFNGSNAFVNVPHSSSLALTSAMTMEAWIRPTTLTGGDWNTVLFKERSGYYGWALYANTGSNRPSANVYTSADHDLRGTAQLPVGAWTHLAATYDGTVIALYVNGTQVATTFASGPIISATGALKLGGNAIWGEWFNGLIDEVRIYSRALSAAEIQTDMNTSITSPDGIPPSAPGTLTATDGLGQISLAWGAATDNVGVARYNVHRSTTPGFTPTTANRIAQPTGTSYVDTGLAAGTYYYKVTAEDAAGNVGPASNEDSAVAAGDTTPPTVSITSPTNGATVSAIVPVNATATDNGSVAGVQFKLDGTNLGAEDTSAPYSVSWDTFTAANGPHSLTALARDGAGNTTLSAGVSVTVQNTGPPGLVGAWAFDEGSGTAVTDQSGSGNHGTASNGTWVTTGKFNNALSFNGTNTWVTIPDSATLDLTTNMTIEAWVRPSILGNWQTAVVKEQPGNLAYGLYGNTNINRPEGEVYVGGQTRLVNGTTALPTGAWSHLAVTYGGGFLRLYLNGAQVAQLAQTGSIVTSASPLRIGGNSIWGEYFNGLIDEVRVYNRALSATEILGDMNRSVTPDVTPPTVTARTPVNGSSGINVGSSATATFSEPMNPGSITTSTFQLKDSSNTSVPANVTYNSGTNVATLSPQSALQYGMTYTVTVKGGSGGVADFAGNALAADASWSFTTEASPPEILVVHSAGANQFGVYLGEILRNEGLNAFTTIDVALISPALLSNFDVVVLGETTLTAGQVTMLTAWVNGGGNLVAMRPDGQLAGLLGLTAAGTTLANAYLKVDTTTPPGTGITGDTIQFHGTADRYTLNGASAVATLYSGPTTPTPSPAVTLRSVGGSGGQAAAFTYDLSRSVVYTRQGNPAWAGQERDGVPGIRPGDMFFPDWIDTNKIAIPQADEQQRLLVNLLTLMERDRMPVPRFWYLPRGEKAVVLLSGDDHSPTQAAGGTASNFNWMQSQSAPGCVVANWECIRASSYIYPNSVLTNAQANTYLAAGFEPALHPDYGACPTTPISEAQLGASLDTQLAQFRAKYTSLPGPFSNRNHCVYWPDWASNAKVELARGMRLDANYYHYPASWIGTRNGFMTGGGFPMRFADLDGTPIDIYQQNTNVTDESTQAFSAAMNTLLDNALGPLGYYGAFGTLIHTDNPAPLPGFEQIVASAQARDVPLISYKQMLDWVDGRNGSTIRGLSWNAGTFTFVTTVGAGANGLQTVLPTQGPSGTLSALTCAGSAKPYTLQTIKGIQYAMFETVTGTCQASYS